jgi:phosphoserine phosphatase
MRYFPLEPSGANEITGALMPNITWCDLPTDVSLWPGLPLSLSGDEVMPLDYHAGRSGWLLYGRGLDKQRLTQYQTKLGAAMVIVAAWCVEDYQVIRLAGSLTQRATRLAHDAGLDVAPLGKIPHLKTPGLLVMDMDSTAIQIECIDEIAKLAGSGELVAEVTERAMRGELDFTASLRQRVATLKGADANILRQVRDAAADARTDATGAEAAVPWLEGGDCLRWLHLLRGLSARETAFDHRGGQRTGNYGRQADRTGDWRYRGCAVQS